jgi:hypothetical protein
MKIKTIIGITLLVVFSLFVLGSFARRSAAQTDTNNSNANSAVLGSTSQGGMMYGGTMYGGMMSGRMMSRGAMCGSGMMGRNMMESHSVMRRMMNQLESDLASARAEASSAKIKDQLADASSLVSKLCGEFSHDWGMMMQKMPMNSSGYCYRNQAGQQQK